MELCVSGPIEEAKTFAFLFKNTKQKKTSPDNVALKIPDKARKKIKNFSTVINSGNVNQKLTVLLIFNDDFKQKINISSLFICARLVDIDNPKLLS